MTTKAGWILRKQRYGSTGAKNPEQYRERARLVHKAIGKPANLTFAGCNYGGVCRQCGKEHGEIEPHTRGLRKWREEHGSPTKGCNFGDICRKCGVNHGPPGMQGKHHSEESKLKSSESNKLAHNTPEMLVKKATDARHQWMRPEVRAKIRRGQREHYDAILEEAEKFKQQGYEVLVVDAIRPDLILRHRESGRVLTVEVDFDMNTPRTKYDPVKSFFDEVIWIERQHVHYTAICQTCGKQFEYMIPTPPIPKYCSRKCYWKSLEGKIPVQAMRARGLV